MQCVPKNISTRYQHCYQDIMFLPYRKTMYNRHHGYKKSLEQMLIGN